jgi:hypothetical protein
MTGTRRRRRRIETPYARITEVREAATSEEANEYLGGGFVLIKAVERRETDALGRQASGIVYILGKPKRSSGNRHQEQTKTEPVDITHGAPDVDPAVLENRPWKRYDNGDGEWTFVVNPDGSRVAELGPAEDFLEALTAGEDLIVGDYRYRLRERFLKRYPVNRENA